MLDSNTITSIGVFFLLLAYFGLTSGKLSKSYIFFTLNIIGSVLAGYGAFAVALWPTVFLEVVFTGVSMYELGKMFLIKK
jgi:hypothetical protein